MHKFSWVLALGLVVAAPGLAQETPIFDREIDYNKMTSAEKTAARREAKQRDFTDLTFCADPGNMPLSNNKREGLQNRIAMIVAEKMGARAQFFWRPFFERGLTRETFDNKECDIIIEVPVGYERILTSIPIYKSTYVFVTHEDADFEITDFDDPDLTSKKVGVFQHSGMREALSRHGIKEGLDLHILSYDADLRPEKQPWNQVRRVAERELDIAGVWGPFAGWVQAQGAPIRLTPANLMEDNVVLEFAVAFGVQSNDVVTKFALDFALIDARDEIAAILAKFGVPLVECAECVVSGTIPAHGTYFGDIIERTQERFVTEVPEEHRQLDLELATPDQVMNLGRLVYDLSHGADPQQEFFNAVLGSDETRVAYLLNQGAQVDRFDKQGATALITAVRNRDTGMIRLLLDNGADINRLDLTQMAPIHHAVLRNHVPTLSLLAERGADLTAKGFSDQTPLALAIAEGMRWAAATLIDTGAPIDESFGRDKLTPLMVLAAQDESRTRNDRVTGGPSVVAIAEKLLARGADVNAATRHGVTALMIAAGGDHNDMLAFLLQSGADAALTNRAGNTALDIAELSQSVRAAQALRILAR